MSAHSLEHALRNARVLVCAGTGGVGKTTIAASLAIQAASIGRRTLVLTIDPARRLANALGLDALDSKPTPVHLEPLIDRQPGLSDASLHAMMLDPKPTFDRLVTRLTEDETARQRILENGIYRHLSEALAGSAEYAAMEQVHELVQSRDYDLIVVDTPPADHALDFLRAPRRLREFLESRFVKTLVQPAMSASRIGMRFFARPLHRMFGLLERIAGVGFLDDLSEFLSAIDGLSEGFRARATRVEEVLLGTDTGFILICGSEAGSNVGTLEFMSELDAFGVRLVSVVVNRMRPWPLAIEPAALLERCQGAALARDQATLAESLASSVESSREKATTPEAAPNPDSAGAARAIHALQDYARICESERRKFAKLERLATDHQVDCRGVPESDGEIDHLAGLLEIGVALRVDAAASKECA